MKNNDIVFVVDDDAAVRDSLRMLLKADGHAVATFEGAEDFLDACTQNMHGCLILDVKMPGMDGPSLQEELNRRGMRMPIIFLSGQGTIQETVRTIKAGAMNFLTKPVDGAELLGSVREALKRDSLMHEYDVERQSIASRLEMLTDREREIMLLSVAGFTSKEIAQKLSISFRTVESHRAHILHKTGASNLMELAHIAAQNKSH